MNPQGSRAGLITAVVILSILFVTAAIFAFYYNAENNKTATALKNTSDNLNKYANPEAQADPQVTALVDLKGEGQYQGMSGIQIAMKKFANLAKLVTGNENPQPSAEQAVASLVESASDKDMQSAGVKVTASSTLADAIGQLTSRVKALATESEQKTAQLTEAAEKLKAETAQRQQMETEFNGKLDEQAKQLSTALATYQQKGDEGTASVGKIQAEADRALKAAQADASKAQGALTKANSTIEELKKEIEVLKQRVPRQKDPFNPVIRQPDGRIVRVPGNDNVFINLGEGDAIAPGLTFEVYDRFSGVPPLTAEQEANPADMDNLPKGKASIEVVRIGQRQSECRIVRSSTTSPVVEGDIIANLVYDKNTKYNFVVFGNFDLDQDKTATPGDAEVVKERVQKWGGRLQDQVNVNCDFVVLGVEPEVPPAVQDESATDIERRRQAEEQLNAYNDVVSKAKGLNIPILNQNRFLYYTGYFEQAQR
jgi:hypothetical protein